MSLSRHHLFVITLLAFELLARPAFGQQVPTPTVYLEHWKTPPRLCVTRSGSQWA